MTKYWLLVLGALCVTTALPTTQDTLVVTREDEVTSAIPTTESPTTPGPAPPLQLTEMDVRSEVSMRYAHTAIVTLVQNPANRSQEATFSVLLPDAAYISGFIMTINGVEYKAYVKDKEEAKQIYDKAVSQGLGAAHVAVTARNSNEFKVSVNLEPYAKAKFNLTCEEMMVRRNDVYNHVINLNPGAVVPQLSVVVHIKEAQKISTLRVPEVRTGNEIDANENDPVNPIATIERSGDNREATITFKPDSEQQRQLIHIYAEKTKEAQESSRRYYNEKTDPQGVLGQFVVQYDVERPPHGEIIVNDGYFVHFFAPESLPPLLKQVVFVLDTSGSMMDRKIVQLRQAMQTILTDLNPGDYFSIVEFNSGVKVHNLSEADTEPEPPKNNYYYYDRNTASPVTLLPPYSATKENIDKAKVIVSRLIASGGTNIGAAFDVAINIVQKGVSLSETPTKTGVVDATGAVATTDGPTRAQTTPETAVANARKDEEKMELESIIVFLTDGEPTVGETDIRRIVNRVTEENTGPRRATIFSLAFGEDADRNFLRKLSLRNDGFMRHIYEAADAALQLQDFYRQISSPLLDDVTFVYPPDQVKENSLTKHKFRTYYAGSEVVVAGRVKEDAVELAPRVQAFCGVTGGPGKKRYEVSTRVPVARRRDPYFPLERLFVYLSIRQLLDQRDAALDSDEPRDKADDPEAKAKELALKYELVTPLTSLVVVKPNATNAVNAESVDNKKFAIANSAGFSGGAYPRMTMLMSTKLASHGYYGSSYRLARPQLPTAAFGGPPRPQSAPVAGFASSVAAAQAPSVAPVAALDPLPAYHMEKYEWAKSLIDVNTDDLIITTNGTTLALRLTKSSDVPRPVTGANPSCARAVGGGAGACVYLTRCSAAQNITAQQYPDFYCIVSTTEPFAGVCCPDASIDQPSP